MERRGRQRERAGRAGKDRRQDAPTSTPASSTESPSQSSASTDPSSSSPSATSPPPLFASGTTSSLPSTSFSPSTNLTSPLSLSPTTPSGSGSNTLPNTFPFTTRSHTYTSTPSVTPKAYVPVAGKALEQGVNGLVVNMTLGGDDVGEAVYSIPVVLGHAGARRKRRAMSSRARDGRDLEARQGADNYETLQLQVDLGSSDMWVAASTCRTSDCNKSGVQKFNAGSSLDSGQYANITYYSGSVSGSIYWDELQIGVTEEEITTSANGTGGGGANGFDIGFQAFIAADQVTQEDLSGGDFSGVLGLAMASNSVIGSIIPGTTTGQPDGATFLDNLFGLGSGAPVGRYFGMSLERRGDSRTRSSLGVGRYDEDVCGVPCVPNYSSIITSSNGPLFWRILLQGISVGTWPSGDPANNSPTYTTINMPSSAVVAQSFPVAVLDSGGSPILFGDRNLLNGIYAVYGVSPASDGNYYLSCTTIMSISLTFNGQQYAMHPLDLSDYSGNSNQCLGLLQFAGGLSAGDVILGSTFLKNVYSVYTYPSSASTTRTASPLVGLVSLTNSTSAASEFYSVRNMHNPLTNDPSSPSGGNTGGNVPANSSTGRHVVSGGIIALGTVLGFVGLAAGLFCAWWFWLRRKHGRNGVVAGRDKRGSGAGDEGEEMDMAVLARRSKKFKSMQRQKSMIDGYSDFEVDSWGGDSKTDEDGEGGGGSRNSRSRSVDTDDERRSQVVVLPEAGVLGNHQRGSGGNGGGAGGNRESRRRISAWESSYPPTGWTMEPPTASPQSTPRRHRDKSPSVNTLGSIGTTATGMSVGASPSRNGGRFSDALEMDQPLPSPTTVPLLPPLMSPTREPLFIDSIGSSGTGGGFPLAGFDAGYESDDRYPPVAVGGGRPKLAEMRSQSATGSILGVLDPMAEEEEQRQFGRGVGEGEVPRRRG